MINKEQKNKMGWVLFWVITSLYVLIVIFTLTVLFNGSGNLTSSERTILFNTFVVEIGVGIFVLFYSIFGLNGCQKTINLLDREGFSILISLHFQNVSAQLIQIFEDIQVQRKDSEYETNYDLLVKDVKSIIHESRYKLAIFHVKGIPDINKFLDGNLPQEKLDELVREAISIALASGNSDEQKKRAIKYIRHTQSDLLKKINEKIMSE